MQPVLLLKQTLEASYDAGALLMYGPNVRFTSADQILSKLPGKTSNSTFTVGIEVDGTQYIEDTFRKKKPKQGFELVEMTFQSDNRHESLRPGMPQNEIESVLPKVFQNIRESFAKTEGTLQWYVSRNRCFLQVGLRPTGGRLNESLFSTFTNNPAGPFEEHIRKLIHVPGLRGNPERTYKTTAVGHEFPGTFENYVASIINHWQMTKDKRLIELGNALEMIGLTWKVEARQVDDTQVELRVGRLRHKSGSSTKDMVNITDVGFGVSQTLPVLIALITAEPGQLVYLEQPEIHLHPKAQGAMAQVLADAAKRGVRVVVETHSTLLLLAVQTLVAEGYLSPEDVKLHWFARNNEGVTEIVSADLDEAGAFGDWPEDFAEVLLDAESRYLDASESRLVQG
jgi:hypothetical protein